MPPFVEAPPLFGFLSESGFPNGFLGSNMLMFQQLFNEGLDPNVVSDGAHPARRELGRDFRLRLRRDEVGDRSHDMCLRPHV